MTGYEKCKFCHLKFLGFFCKKTCFDERVFKIIGVSPYHREFRDIVDWFYLSLWLTSIGYQILLLTCFFIYPDWTIYLFYHQISIPKLLGQANGAYLTAVGGYGIFNVFHRFRINERRSQSINVSMEKRKRRNGHRFILYWWLNFLTMFLATTFFDYSGDLTTSETTVKETSFWIAMGCSVIAIGYYKSRHISKTMAEKLNNIKNSAP